jgi:hypothetical protein
MSSYARVARKTQGGGSGSGRPTGSATLAISGGSCIVKNKGKVALTCVSCSVLLNGCSSVCMPVRLSQLVYQQTLRFVRLHMLTVS